MIRSYCVLILALAILLSAASAALAEDKYERLETLPADFPFALRDGDATEKIARSTSASAKIVTLTCRTKASVDMVAEHYKKSIKGFAGFRVFATDEDRTLSNGRAYQRLTVTGIARYKARISISINNMDKGRTTYFITWHHYTAVPKGAPADWTPATYVSTK